MNVQCQSSVLAVDDDPKSASRRSRALRKDFKVIEPEYGHDAIRHLMLSHRLRFELIKVDESLICHIGHRRESEQMIRVVVTFARHLGIMVVAAGIENLEEAGRLKSLVGDQGMESMTHLTPDPAARKQ